MQPVKIQELNERENEIKQNYIKKEKHVPIATNLKYFACRITNIDFLLSFLLSKMNIRK